MLAMRCDAAQLSVKSQWQMDLDGTDRSSRDFTPVWGEDPPAGPNDEHVQLPGGIDTAAFV